MIDDERKCAWCLRGLALLIFHVTAIWFDLTRDKYVKVLRTVLRRCSGTQEWGHPGLSNVLSNSNTWRPDIFITYFPHVLIALPLDIIFSGLRSLPLAFGGNLGDNEKKNPSDIFVKAMMRKRTKVLSFELAWVGANRARWRKICIKKSINFRIYHRDFLLSTFFVARDFFEIEMWVCVTIDDRGEEHAYLCWELRMFKFLLAFNTNAELRHCRLKEQRTHKDTMISQFKGHDHSIWESFRLNLRDGPVCPSADSMCFRRPDRTEPPTEGLRSFLSYLQPFVGSRRVRQVAQRERNSLKVEQGTLPL